MTKAIRFQTMEEVRSVPWNGYRAISTFSGTGGSCLGYRMAGFRVLWASEFVKLAQQCYKLNHPDSILDTRDIREVSAEDIMSATGVSVGELDMVDGSPPCSNFSLAGSREKAWGKVKSYSSNRSQRSDDLFFEFARLVKGLQPRSFVAENVAGLVMGSAKGYFKEIMKKLKDCGYQVKAKILDAQWLGVPQRRKRLIFIGIRNDLKATPVFPVPHNRRIMVSEVCPHIEKICIGVGHKGDGLVPADSDVSPTILQSEAKLSTSYVNHAHGLVVGPSPEIDNPLEIGRLLPMREAKKRPPIYVKLCEQGLLRKWSIPELRRICGFPDDFALVGSVSQRWERLGRAVPPLMAMEIGLAVARVLKGVDDAGQG